MQMIYAVRLLYNMINTYTANFHCYYLRSLKGLFTEKYQFFKIILKKIVDYKML